jgi:hypothetical protein
MLIARSLASRAPGNEKATLKQAHFLLNPPFTSYFAMLELLSRQALKALRSSLHNSLPNPLRVHLQTRHLHNELAPLSGPPSHANLARRSSASNPNPRRFFAQKAAKLAIDWSKFSHIPDYDVLSTDTYDDMVHSEISKLVGIPYLKEATKDEAGKVAREFDGIVYGQKLRMIFQCVLSIDDKSRWVFFLVHSGSPLTYISTEVSVHPRRKHTLATNSTLGGTSLRS